MSCVKKPESKRAEVTGKAELQAHESQLPNLLQNPSHFWTNFYILPKQKGKESISELSVHKEKEH